MNIEQPRFGVLASLKRYENQLGTLGAILVVVMVTSQIEVAWSNFQDHSVI